MPVTRAQKEAQVRTLSERFRRAKSVIFLQHAGLSVNEVTKFRAALRQEEAELKVGKKTLMRIAAVEVGYPSLSEQCLEGSVGLILSYRDEVGGPRVALQFQQQHPTLVFNGGIYQGAILTAQESEEFARIPPRPVLLTCFVRSCAAPLHHFALICTSPLASFARGVRGVGEQKTAQTSP